MKKYCKKYKESYGEIKSYRLSERYYDPCTDEYVFIGVNPLGKKRTVGKISRERIIAASYFNKYKYHSIKTRENFGCILHEPLEGKK